MNPVHRMSMRAHIDQYGEEGVAGLVHQNCLRHLSLGITSVGDALVTPESAEVYRIADRLNKLPIMIHQMRGGDEFYRPPVKASKGEYTGDNVSDRLRGNIMKIFMDPVYPDNADVRHHHDGSTEHVDTGTTPRRRSTRWSSTPPAATSRSRSTASESGASSKG